ncbi:MAG: CBS domain-containing protein [Polyangiales bacterium]
MKQARSVSAHMSAIAHAVGPQATLAEAQQRMRELVVQQLPVVDDAGQPCGVLLERDLHVAKQLGAAFDSVTVGTVIPHAAFSVKSDEPLVGAVRTMASRAAANAVVLDGSTVSGVLTTHDVLRVLAEVLEARDTDARRAATEEREHDVQEDASEQAADASRIRPVHGRTPEGVPITDATSALPSSEQSGCSLLDAGYLLERVEDFAGKLLRGETESDADELEKSVRELHDVQATLLASERRELEQTRADLEPLHRTRLEQLCEERARHTQALATLLLELDRRSKPTSAIAGHALQAAAALRAYIERERDPLRFVS